MTISQRSEQAPLQLPDRDPQGHKGTFGTVSIIGGCAQPQTRMIGAPALSGIAAHRAGTGLVRLLMPEPVLDAALTIAPSCTGSALAVDENLAIIPHESAPLIDHALNTSQCIALGPGLGASPAIATITLRVLSHADIPVVVDADAINALAQSPQFWQQTSAPMILTPHPGEYARLAASLGISQDAVDPARRPKAALSLAQRLGCIVVLKGANTIVTDGHRQWTNTTGSSALATAGTGDVLTGIIASLIAQYAKSSLTPSPSTPPSPDLFDLTCMAVYTHGAASELWIKQNQSPAGLLAMDLTSFIPQALHPAK